MKKIVITGATGSIGRNLVRELSARGDEVIIFTQNPEKAKKNIANASKYVKWEYERIDLWSSELHGVDTVVHLAGANLAAKRLNDVYKKLAYESRVLSTRKLIEAIRKVEVKPKVFICANAVGYYGNRYDEILTEESTPGNDFFAKLCYDWENEAKKVEQLGIRRVSLRTGLVLMKNEGVIKQLLLPFQLFIGGPLGNGLQWFPWIHIDDVIGIYLNAIDNKNLSGSVNTAAPGIVRMKEFAKTFGKILKRPAFFTIPKFVIKIVAGEIADFVVMSQRTSVDKILNAGYKFKFNNLGNSLEKIINESNK